MLKKLIESCFPALIAIFSTGWFLTYGMDDPVNVAEFRYEPVAIFLELTAIPVAIFGGYDIEPPYSERSIFGKYLYRVYLWRIKTPELRGFVRPIFDKYRQEPIVISHKTLEPFSFIWWVTTYPLKLLF